MRTALSYSISSRRIYPGSRLPPIMSSVRYSGIEIRSSKFSSLRNGKLPSCNLHGAKVKTCSIIGCGEKLSEILSTRRTKEAWRVFPAGYQTGVEGDGKTPITLPFEIVLCPKHRQATFDTLLEDRKASRN